MNFPHRLSESLAHFTNSILINKDNKRQKLLFQTLPKIGIASYLINSTKFLAPVIFSKVCGNYSLRVSQLLLATSITGNSLFILSHRHLNPEITPAYYAVYYSVFGSIFFNFGSILAWMLSKTYLPDNPVFVAVFGYASGLVFIHTAKSYLLHVENLTNQ